MDKRKQIVCNKCGREIAYEKGIATEDYLAVKKSWGYFSRKDGMTNSFILCEDCSDNLMRSFKIPVSEADTTELL